MKFKLDISKLEGKIGDKVANLNPQTLLRPIAFDLIAKMTERIHDQGMGSDGQPIKAGGYSSSYLKYRQKYHNRSADPKVIISLTRQLENDWSVVQTQGGYGIGFKNQINYDKVGWMHDLFGDRIFHLSTEEREYAQSRFKELVSEQFGT